MVVVKLKLCVKQGRGSNSVVELARCGKPNCMFRAEWGTITFYHVGVDIFRLSRI
jgi:hypothetical protein